MIMRKNKPQVRQCSYCNASAPSTELVKFVQRWPGRVCTETLYSHQDCRSIHLATIAKQKEFERLEWPKVMEKIWEHQIKEDELEYWANLAEQELLYTYI